MPLRIDLRTIFAKKVSMRQLYERIPPSSIDKWDAYIDIYERLFLPFRMKPISILEIGIFRGGSLNLWRQYFCPNSVVVGLDIDKDAKRFESTGVSVEIGDQADPSFANRVATKYGGFDIVIDDGGHKWGQQRSSFESLYDSTRSLYVIEDTHTSLWSKYDDTQSGENFLAFSKSKIDVLYEYFSKAGSSESFYNESAEKLTASRFRSETNSIEFFDSMIVFKKERNPPPRRRLIPKVAT